ncbi:MAG: SMC-Scp complex subunit ScpB, partial [Candidatus Krumholzibacteria bacterium]|nr:SMC-Scp complex subunit ScpB [Candidatus Krumholzibacteria bacterium]
LFASPDALSAERIKSIIPYAGLREVRSALSELAESYDSEGRSFQLSELGGGWRIVTRKEYSKLIEKMMHTRRKSRLSRAALETLAVIAYRQPCTRFDIEQVRGVNSGASLSTLLEHELLKITGRAETVGRPLLYSTTENFLSHLGINELGDLPNMAEIEALLTPPADLLATPALPEERRKMFLEGIEEIQTLLNQEHELPVEETQEEESVEMDRILQDAYEDEKTALEGKTNVVLTKEAEVIPLHPEPVPATSEPGEE